jgi:RNA-binding protein
MDFRDQKQELTEELAEASGSALISIIGNIAILYREQPDPEKRKIVFSPDL